MKCQTHDLFAYIFFDEIVSTLGMRSIFRMALTVGVPTSNYCLTLLTWIWLYKTKDKVNLETQTARISLSQSLQRVELAESSLHKAMENEKKATERYMAGEITIIEVIDAQVYRMNTQINFTEAKVNAQSSYVQLIKALNLYGSDGNIISLYK